MEKESPRLPDIPGYTSERILGKGGMATVYLAMQESLSRHVGLKVMNRFLVLDEGFRRRFLNEGQLIAQLSHPNIVTVYDIGTSEGEHYLSMTYLPGGTLQQKIRGGLSPIQVVDILTALANALGYAHRQGIVHRDIKPGNVLFSSRGAPVLTDFGIAKSIGSETQVTSTGVTVGSAKYMSPEQTLGKAVDKRSDLYSLGVVFWLMLTGKAPYEAEDPFALAFKHARDPIPELPDHLRRFQPIVQRLLAKQPEERFARAEELLEALGAIPSGDLHQAKPSNDGATVVLPSLPTQATPAKPRMDPPRPSAPTRRAWVLPAVGTVTVLVGIAALIPFSGLLSPRGLGETPVEDRQPGATHAPDEIPTEGATSRPDSGMATAIPATSPDLPIPRSRQAAGRALSDADGTGTTDQDQRIGELLEKAGDQWEAGRLTDPPGDNAFESYRSILEVDPGHIEARQKLVEIGRVNAANKVFLAADRLLRTGEIDDARHLIETGLKMNPDDKRLLGLRKALD